MATQDTHNLAGLGKPVTGRFVLLHHTGIEAPHYDLMLQMPDLERLPTWRLPPLPIERWPASSGLNPICFNCERLPDHRVAYLTYEGPVSNNRGQVVRIGAAGYVLTPLDGQRLLVSLQFDHRQHVLLLPAS